MVFKHNDSSVESQCNVAVACWCRSIACGVMHACGIGFLVPVFGTSRGVLCQSLSLVTVSTRVVCRIARSTLVGHAKGFPLKLNLFGCARLPLNGVI